MSRGLVEAWYRPGSRLYGLAPLAWLYGFVARVRRWLYRSGILRVYRAAAPVIVIGNITAGGAGKTPLTGAIVNQLRRLGRRPVVISRGYGGHAGHYPLLVGPDSMPDVTGDEPLMLCRQTGAPVVVDPRRGRGAAWALAQGLGDTVVCDDGLQHLALARDLELVVIDGARGLGNGRLLPQGPLRESAGRLGTVDAVIINGVEAQAALWRTRTSAPVFVMGLVPDALTPLHEQSGPAPLPGDTVHAVAGIGNPDRFFRTLESLGFKVIPHPFPDHHDFRREELVLTGAPLVMTAKDAVKCSRFTDLDAWVLPVTAELGPDFENFLRERLAPLLESRDHAG